jgi:hypothetical protein
MSLNIAQLKTDLGNLYDETLADQGSAANSKTVFINQLAAIIDGYVKSIKVVYTDGLIAPNGAVTGEINHTIE